LPLADALNPEAITLLVGHIKFEEDYKQLYEKIKSANEEEGAAPEEEVEEGKTVDKEADLKKLNEYAVRIKQSIRNIIRYFHEKRSEFEKLRDIIGHKKSSKIQDFTSVFVSQYDVFKQKMTTSKEEEDSKSEQLKLLEEKITRLRKEKEDRLTALRDHKSNKQKTMMEAKKELEKLRVTFTIT
jgi:hypothetical protein